MCVVHTIQKDTIVAHQLRGKIFDLWTGELAVLKFIMLFTFLPQASRHYFERIAH